MADNEGTETKEKRTVPALVRTPRGVADHAAAVLEMQWDKERKAFKDPVTVMMALMSYAKLTPALLDEAVDAADVRSTALEVRVEKLEQQIAAFEMWRANIEKQSAEMAQGFEEMMRGGGPPLAKLQEMLEARNTELPPPLPPPPPLPTIIDAADDTVVPLKATRERERDGKQEKNGGAA